MIITVLSKDKISLSMFVDFYKTLYDSEAEVLDLNTLISQDMLDTIVRNAIGTNLTRATSESSVFLIKLKTKKSMTVEELPTEIKFKSDYIVQFDLFSTKPEILKDRDGKFAPVLERWEANIEKMNAKG